MEINNNKTKSVSVLGKVDISDLIYRVKELSEADWDTQEDFEANYNKEKGALLNAKHIILKFSNKQIKPYSYFECSRWADWKDVLLPIMNKATEHYNYKNGFYSRVMLAKLAPKSFIRMHKDGDVSGTKPHKIHIPLITNNEVFFFAENERFNFKVNSAYEVNNSARHGAANNGSNERIHLIFEYLDFDAQTKEIQHQMNEIY